jgi:hypothetical protein
LIETRAGATYFAKRIAGVWQQYDLGSENRLVGKSAPDVAFKDRTRLGTYLQAGRAVLLVSATYPITEWRSENAFV